MAHRPFAGAFYLSLSWLLLTGLSCRPQPAPTSWQEPLGYRPEQVHPIRIGALGLPVVPIEIDGARLEAVFDTGDMAGIVLPSPTIARLGLRQAGEAPQYDGSGRRIGTVTTWATEAVVFLGDTLREQRVIGIDPAGVPGLVGPSAVPGSRFTVDYGCPCLAASDAPSPPAREGTVELPLLRSSRFPRLILVRGTVQGTPVVVEIDTGKSRTVVDPALADRLALPPVAGGHRIEELRIGSRVFAVPSARRDGLAGIDPTLPEPVGVGMGSDLLANLVFTVDFDRGVLRIE